MQRILSHLGRGVVHCTPEIQRWSQGILEEHKAKDLLVELNRLKRASCSANRPSNGSSSSIGIDYARALCFLSGEGDLFEVRQALLEELRHFPQHVAARDLLDRIQPLVRPHLLPPVQLTSSSGTLTGENALSPLFSLLCDSLLDHTMLSWKRLFNLYAAVEQLYASEWHEDGNAAPPNRFPIVECGTAAGGSAVLLAVAVDQMEHRLATAFPHKASAPRRQIFCLDTFSGMPDPSVRDEVWKSSFSNWEGGEEGIRVMRAEDSAWSTGTCAAPASHLQSLAEGFGVADRMVILPGRFEDTIPNALLVHPLFRQRVEPHSESQNALVAQGTSGSISLLHVDADWYDSTKVVLEALLVHLVRGDPRQGPAVVQVDDYYYWRGCQEAVDEVLQKWRVEQGMSIALEPVDHNAVFFEWW